MVGNMIKFTRVAAAGLALAVGGAALAQQEEGGFSKPLRSGRGQAGGETARSVMVMRNDDGQNQVELRVEDGKYSAKVNGKSIPEDRIVREKDEVRILDKEGNVLSTFHVMVGGDGGAPLPPKAPRAPRAPRAYRFTTPAVPAQPMQPPAMAAPPKVMLGITMGELSDDMLKNYDLKEGQAILVQRVIEGLPADKAGLREDDVITEIDGKKPANPETLRDTLRDKDPGDTVTLTVLRKGGDKTIRVTLAAFDETKLGMNALPGMGFEEGAEGGPEADARNQAEQALREAMRQHNFGQGRLRIPGDGAQGFVFGVPGNLDDKMAELDKKMAELDEKLAKVNERIAKLQELLEKVSKEHGKD